MHPIPAVNKLSRQSFTAYSVYFQQERRRLLGQGDDNGTRCNDEYAHGKRYPTHVSSLENLDEILDFHDLSHVVANSWQGLEPEIKVAYGKLAAFERHRFETEQQQQQQQQALNNYHHSSKKKKQCNKHHVNESNHATVEPLVLPGVPWNQHGVQKVVVDNKGPLNAAVEPRMLSCVSRGQDHDVVGKDVDHKVPGDIFLTDSTTDKKKPVAATDTSSTSAAKAEAIQEPPPFWPLQGPCLTPIANFIRHVNYPQFALEYHHTCLPCTTTDGTMIDTSTPCKKRRRCSAWEADDLAGILDEDGRDFFLYALLEDVEK